MTADEKYMKEAIRQEDERLAPGGLYDVCDAGAVPDVLRCDHPGQDQACSGRMYESEGGMRGVHLESAGNEGV